MSFKSQLEILATMGLTPYIATSRAILHALDQSLIGRAGHIYLLEREDDRAFHEAFRLANALAFTSPPVKMPDWVLVDCALMPTAIVGFAMARRRVPEDLLKLFREDPTIDLDHLDHVPVSGQIVSLSFDAKRLVGFSLFSLRRYLSSIPALGVVTKALALQVYRARGRRFAGIARWDNKALSIHGKFGRPMFVELPIIPAHPGRNMVLSYGMTIDFQPDELYEREEPGEYDFLMRADDEAKKREMIRGQAEGISYIIAPPYQIERDGDVLVPVRVAKSAELKQTATI